MRKLVIALVLVGIGGWVAYAKVWRTPAKRACAHLRELCGESGDAQDDQKDCDELFDTVAKSDGDKTLQCVIAAKTCPEAIGCTAGGAVKLGTDAAKQFLDGFSKSIK